MKQIKYWSRIANYVFDAPAKASNIMGGWLHSTTPQTNLSYCLIVRFALRVGVGAAGGGGRARQSWKHNLPLPPLSRKSWTIINIRCFCIAVLRTNKQLATTIFLKSTHLSNCCSVLIQYVWVPSMRSRSLPRTYSLFGSYPKLMHTRSGVFIFPEYIFLMQL